MMIACGVRQENAESKVMPAARHILARRHGQAAAHPTTCFRCRASALGSEQLFHMRHGVLALVHTGERVLNSTHSHLTDTYPVAFRHDTQSGRRRRLKTELRTYHALNGRAGASRTSEAECRYRHLPCSDVLDETTSCIPLQLPPMLWEQHHDGYSFCNITYH